jgi:hypothetical protein
MAIDLFWDETVPHIMHYRFRQGWSWEDFRKTALQEHQWGEALADIRYDIIADLSKATFPKGTPFSNIVRLFDQGPHNRKMIVVYGSPLARAMIEIGAQLYPRVKGRFHAANSLEEARQLIESMRTATGVG